MASGAEQARNQAAGPARSHALFYSHDGFGLGHLRTALELAGALARRRPDAAIRIATATPAAGLFVPPAGVELVPFPPLGTTVTEDVPPVHVPWRRPIRGIWALRAARLAAIVHDAAPALVHVEHAPAGLGGELSPVLAAWRDLPAGERPRLILGLPDIADTPAAVRRDWTQDGAYPLLDQLYDQILIYGEARVFDPVTEYGFSPAAAAKTVFCGYLPPAAPAVSVADVRDRLSATAGPLLLVTAGGGKDGAPLVEAALAALRRPALAGVAALLVTGPLLDQAARAALEAAAPRPGITISPFCPDLVAAVAAADVVVTMGGYNAVREAIGLGKRPVIVPRTRRDRPTSEQLIRAERMAALGLATLLHPDDLTPVTLARAIRAELDRGISPPPVLDFGGLARATELLAAGLR